MTKKSEIEALVASELPDQNKREITPPRLRAVFLGFVDRAVLQDQDFPAGNLTGTLADAVLPTSQAGKTFTSPVQHASGTASLPGVTFAGDTDTGMFRPGANILAWATGGVERARIDSSGDVGIGLTVPTSRLDVNGTAQFRGITQIGGQPNNGLRIVKSSTNLIMQVGNGTNTAGVSGTDAFQISPWLSSSPYFHVAPSGNVGIGTSSPTFKLHVIGTSRFAGQLDGTAATFTQDSYCPVEVNSGTVKGQLAANAGGTVDIRAVSNHALTLRTNNSERMRIDASGNVLIGTSATGASKLRLVGLPTSATGLSSGDVWNDGGTLKIAS